MHFFTEANTGWYFGERYVLHDKYILSLHSIKLKVFFWWHIWQDQDKYNILSYIELKYHSLHDEDYLSHKYLIVETICCYIWHLILYALCILIFESYSTFTYILDFTLFLFLEWPIFLVIHNASVKISLHWSVKLTTDLLE